MSDREYCMSYKNSRLEGVIDSFVTSNSQITSKYFQFTEKVADLLVQYKENDELSRLLSQVENVTLHYLDSQQQLVAVLKNLNNPSMPNLFDNQVPFGMFDEHKNALNLVLSEEKSKKQQTTLVLSNEHWLKAEIAETTGYALENVDLNKSFIELGMDSINLLDLVDNCIKKFNQLHSKKAELVACTSPCQFLKIIDNEFSVENKYNSVADWVTDQLVAISGYEKNQIDIHVPYQQLGIDSIALFDLIDNIKKKWSVSASEIESLVEAQTPKDTIEIINRLETSNDKSLEEKIWGIFNNHLFQLSPDLDKNYEVNQRFSDLGVNGFKRQALWENIAIDLPECAFLGEALIATRTPAESINLLLQFMQ